MTCTCSASDLRVSTLIQSCLLLLGEQTSSALSKTAPDMVETVQERLSCYRSSSFFSTRRKHSRKLTLPAYGLKDLQRSLLITSISMHSERGRDEYGWRGNGDRSGFGLSPKRIPVSETCRRRKSDPASVTDGLCDNFSAPFDKRRSHVTQHAKRSEVADVLSQEGQVTQLAVFDVKIPYQQSEIPSVGDEIWVTKEGTKAQDWQSWGGKVGRWDGGTVGEDSISEIGSRSIALPGHASIKSIGRDLHGSREINTCPIGNGVEIL
ncbi:hypothetical protein RRG08_043554 [Elysia crispata]|uniref:Uncharacterized protein n=1 Tax=Elysia crispata TaxID=231223 RepID=A0AAE0YFX9_9GAST|nr:hypothetical protein RRG08_043554 [Elysia crispata]